MKYFVILFGFLFLLGFTGIAFAQYMGDNDPPEVLEERIGVGLTKDITWAPPIKQIKQFEREPENVKCNSGLELIFKLNGSPACVKAETKTKLIERGWGSENFENTTLALQQVIDSCANDSPQDRMANPLRYTNETHVFLNLGCEWKRIGQYVAEPEPQPEPESEIIKKARDLGIDNVMEAVDSEVLSFDEKREYIQARYEEDGPVTTPSLNIRIKDFTRDLEYGERPTFTVIETGYANPCTSPKLEVYSLKQDIGNDHTNDDLIYEDQIIRSCPFFDSFYPILNFWDESDFKPFPICENEGRYLVVGDSGYERIPLEEYYCVTENEN